MNDAYVSPSEVERLNDNGEGTQDGDVLLAP